MEAEHKRNIGYSWISLLKNKGLLNKDRTKVYGFNDCLSTWVLNLYKLMSRILHGLGVK